jgi:hypothetical protein
MSAPVSSSFIFMIPLSADVEWSGGAAAHTSTLHHGHLLSFSSSYLSIQTAWNSCRQCSIRTRSPFSNWDRQTAHSLSFSSGPPAHVRHGSRSPTH